MPDILSEIISAKKRDIKNLGFAFGEKIPSARKKKVLPFMENKGAILEIKKASPSKGDIAPNLDILKTAQTYANNGARAISVLTERNFFKGSLGDLKLVSDALENIAILRKDFIIFKEEIEISYLFGADAVLLIARILSQSELAELVAECLKFKMTPFIEVRDEACIEKLRALDCANRVIVGINSRDLKNFRIDSLIPSKFKLDSKLIFESGILSKECANFVALRGFHGILVGEAAAKNPRDSSNIVEGFNEGIRFNETSNLAHKNALFWEKIAKINHRPLVKICGITNAQDAQMAIDLGADFVGFIFSNKSPRSVKNARTIIESLNLAERKPFFIGVITDINSAEGKIARELAENDVLDALQFHACEIVSPNLCDKFAAFSAINLKETDDIKKLKNLLALGYPRVLIDSFSSNLVGGSGKRINADLINLAKKEAPLWLAGGINAENVNEILKDFTPELIDVSSGLEREVGKKDSMKMKAFFKEINKEKI